MAESYDQQIKVTYGENSETERGKEKYPGESFRNFHLTATKCAPRKVATEAHFVAMQFTTNWTDHCGTPCRTFSKLRQSVPLRQSMRNRGVACPRYLTLWLRQWTFKCYWAWSAGRISYYSMYSERIFRFLIHNNLMNTFISNTSKIPWIWLNIYM
jgi:hypothetical protein